MSATVIESIIKDFDPIGLEDMDKVQLMNRTDTKFTFSLPKLIELLPLLSKDYRILSVDGNRISAYESLYYDDDGMSSYIDHHRKKLNRFKIRFRKYVHSDIAFLEVKHKNKGRTDKKRVQVEDIHYEMDTDQFDFVKSTGVASRSLEPTLLNNFNRITLVGKAIDERLTIDFDLSFSWEAVTEKIDDIVIAELKQNNFSRNSPFYVLMKRNLIRPLKISKYCIGIVKLYQKDNIKYNRFKKKILQLIKLQNDIK